MRYLLLLSLLSLAILFSATGCNFGNGGDGNGDGNDISETSEYKNGTIMIKDNTSYRDYGKSPESFDTVIESESENVDVGPQEVQFGQE